jgi:glycosyltransferase involved in cell wall biosynthesis
MRVVALMRIALVVPGGLDRSGRERVIPILLWLIERLARRHTVHAFVLRHYPEPCTYQLLGATVHDLGRANGPTGLRSILQLRHLVRALQLAGPFDVIHGYWGVPAGLPAAMAGRWLRTPTVVTCNSGEFVCLRPLRYGMQCSWRGRLTVALATRLATRVHVTSLYMERLAKEAGLGPELIPLGVDTRTFRPATTEPPAGPPWRLLHVATLNRVKDQPTLLRALARVVALRPGVHLDVVGEDTLGGAVQNLCDGLRLRQHVTFHGFQPTERLPAFYQRAHLLVVTSRHEAAGVVVLEAAASGLPTIGSAVGYVADWSPSAAYGVPAGDETALADGILTLLGDPARRERLAHEAARRARAQDADWSANAIERLYNAGLPDR